MKDKEIIKSYFENYYPNNNKYIYNEDWGIGAIIFLFLVFLMTKTFSSEKTPEIISKKIDDDPYIPEKIIKNLENIKRILIQHNPGQDLKEVLDLLDYIDDNLNELKRNPDNSKNLISSINDQLVKFLQYILKLYSKQDPNKKNILFIELNKILTLFGLSDIFRTLLKTANDNNQITKDNSTEKVRVTSFDDLDLGSEEETEESSESEDDEEDDDEITLNDTLKDFDVDDVFKDMTLDQIKKEIINKKQSINSNKKINKDIIKIFNYIISNFNKYNENDIKYLYMILKEEEELDSFENSDIFTKTTDFIEQEEYEKINKSDYEKLLNKLKEDDFFVHEYKQFFWIKIDVNKYKIKKIKPLKKDDLSDDFYYMSFTTSNEFEIKIKEKDKDKYRLYSVGQIFSFIMNENNNSDKEFLDALVIFQGQWEYDDDENNVKIKKIKKHPSNDLSEQDVEESITSSKTFIGKMVGSNIRKLKYNPSSIGKNDQYYYCIKNGNDFFIREIDHDFSLSIKEIYEKKYFKYSTKSLNSIYRFNDKDDLKDLIFIDTQTEKNHAFLNKIKPIKNNKLNFEDVIFQKINPNVVGVDPSNSSIIVINMSRQNAIL